MTQRMKELGGSCHITSQPGNGCTIELFMPLVSSRRHLLRMDWLRRLRRPHKNDNQPPQAAPKRTPN
jgi:hypothetical protein